jgi:hypothetical protein
MSLHCTCADWEPQIAIVNGPIALQSVRSGGAYKYPGKQFIFCPWCGNRLTDLAVMGTPPEPAPVRPRPETNRCQVCGTPTFGLYCAKHTRGGRA